jgi:lipoyl(octanoyl) transferase
MGAMQSGSTRGSPTANGDFVLRAYLLGRLEWDSALALQRHLVYEIGENRDSAALILCEHPPLITVGRQGSTSHLLCGPEELAARRWRVRWVNRGGGCLLQVPGQLAIYFILPLDRLGMGVHAYLDALSRALLRALDGFRLGSRAVARKTGIWVGERPIAAMGVAIRDWISYHGAFLNIDPDLEAFRLVRWGTAASAPMTSMARERHGSLRAAIVRERVLESFRAAFGFHRLSLFTEHPSLRRKVAASVCAASS